MATEEENLKTESKAEAKTEPPKEPLVKDEKQKEEAKETPSKNDAEKPKEKLKEESEKPPTGTSTEKPKESAPAQNGGSKTGLIIVLVVVFLVIILGVGGFFAWKYLIKGKLSKKTSPTGGTTTSDTTAAKSKLQQLEDLLKYPKGTITNTEHNTSYGALTNLTMASEDSIDTIHQYYLDLAKKNSWTTGAERTSAADGTNSVSIKGKGFNFDVSSVKGDDGKSKVEITIYSDDINAVDLTNSATTSTTTTPTTSTKATTTTTASTTKSSIADDYVIADSNTRVISKSELTSLTPWQLKVARNEIYARHGREFVHKDLQCYFGTKSWYQVNATYDNSQLSTTENKNVATIQAYENEIASPLASKDSGC